MRSFGEDQPRWMDYVQQKGFDRTLTIGSERRI